MRQPHQLTSDVCLIEIKYCEDTGPGQQLEAVQRQHADPCKLISSNTVTLHTILLGVGVACYTERTLNQSKQLGLDHHHVTKLANFMPILTDGAPHRKACQKGVQHGEQGLRFRLRNDWTEAYTKQTNSVPFDGRARRGTGKALRDGCSIFKNCYSKCKTSKHLRDPENPRHQCVPNSVRKKQMEGKEKSYCEIEGPGNHPKPQAANY
eukprot:212921-Pelagomonas_calceolata.AAC.1